MCSEALYIAENIIHPRLPVVGVEALSRSIADSRSQADADKVDAEPSLIGCDLGLGHSDDQPDVEQDNAADVEVHHSSVTELCPVPASLCTVPLSTMESSHTEEYTELSADDVVCSPDEETVTEVSETAVTRNVDKQNDATSPASGHELEKSDSVSFVSVASSFAVSPKSSSLSRAVREYSAADESFEEPTTSPALASPITQFSGSDAMTEKLLDCSQSESQQSSRKRKYSTTSSVNDGDDSESEVGEIEV